MKFLALLLLSAVNVYSAVVIGGPISGGDFATGGSGGGTTNYIAAGSNITIVTNGNLVTISGASAGTTYTNNSVGTPGTITGSGISSSLDASSLTNYAASNLVSGGTIPVGTLFTATTNSNIGGFLLETIGGIRFRTYNGASLTGIVASGISGVYASNITSGGVLPQGTVSASTMTAGLPLGNDGSLRQWTNRITLGQIDGNGGIGSTNLQLNSRLIITNSLFANTFWSFDQNGNWSYTTNNVTKSSGTGAGGAIFSGVVTASGGLTTSGNLQMQNASITLDTSSRTISWTAGAGFGSIGVDGSANLVTSPIKSSGSVTATNGFIARVVSTTTPGFKSTGTNNMILTCPDGGSFILKVDNTGVITAATNTTAL